MRSASPLVLSLYVNSRGIGFVLFDDPLSPYDWGVRRRYGKNQNRGLLRAVHKLLDQYEPALVILEDWEARNIPRYPRVTRLYASIVKLAGAVGTPVELVPMHAVRQEFAAIGATNKYEIAQKIAKHIPALDLAVPVRKIWLPEEPHQAIFDAAALALTFFQRGAH